jgi:ankyrin repeat protein
MLACKSQKNQVEVTKALLTADADPQIRDRNGLSPLNYANTEGSSEVADILEAECVAGASAKVLAEALEA